MSDAKEDFYTLVDVATKTSFTERYLRERITDGTLKAYKTGRKWFVLHSDLLKFVMSETDTTTVEEKPKKSVKTPKTKG